MLPSFWSKPSTCLDCVIGCLYSCQLVLAFYLFASILLAKLSVDDDITSSHGSINGVFQALACDHWAAGLKKKIQCQTESGALSAHSAQVERKLQCRQLHFGSIQVCCVDNTTVCRSIARSCWVASGETNFVTWPLADQRWSYDHPLSQSLVPMLWSSQQHKIFEDNIF